MADSRFMMTAFILVAGLLDFAANYLAAHWLFAVGTFLIPGGTLLFALGFTVYDFLRRQYGFSPTAAAVVLGFTLSIAYNVAFGGGVARIAVAGIIALACSSVTDLLTQTVTLRWPIWRYVATTNAISLLVDTIVFTEIAFSMLPPSVRLHIAEGQYGAKILMTLVAIPLVYAARSYVPSAPQQNTRAGAIA